MPSLSPITKISLEPKTQGRMKFKSFLYPQIKSRCDQPIAGKDAAAAD